MRRQTSRLVSLVVRMDRRLWHSTSAIRPQRRPNTFPNGSQIPPFGWEYPGEDTSWVARGGGGTSGEACEQADGIPRGVSGSCNMIGWSHDGCEDRWWRDKDGEDRQR